MRTIRVTGRGRLKLRPDLTRITLTLEGTSPDYGETLARSARETEGLRELLGGFGFAPDALKTLDFGVDTEYEGYQEEGVYRQRFLGYRFRHQMKLEFPSDNALLGRVLYALASSPARPEFRVSYTVRDAEAAKNELLAAAVADARAKAEQLARAAMCSLGALQSVDYALGEPDLEVRPMARGLAAEACAPRMAKASFDLNVEPDDIEVTDSVTLIWEIG